MFVPPLLKQHGLGQFVLVTSQQHIARALAAFRAVGTDPVPSTPDVYVAARSLSRDGICRRASRLAASERLFYDLIGMGVLQSQRMDLRDQTIGRFGRLSIDSCAPITKCEISQSDPFSDCVCEAAKS